MTARGIACRLPIALVLALCTTVVTLAAPPAHPRSVATSLPADAFLTARTRSEHARHVHEALSRLLLTEGLGLLSNLELVESVDARGNNVLELRTVVRTVARESYRAMRPRELEPPETRARRLVEQGMSAGVIARHPQRG